MRKTLITILVLLQVAILAACSTVSPLVTSVDTGQAVVATSAVDLTANTDAPDQASTLSILTQKDTHDDAGDYSWDAATVVPIVLNGDSIQAQGSGMNVEGTSLTISSPGTYSLSGTLSDGQIIVNADGEGIVRLILNGADLNNSSSAPIVIEDAQKVMIVLAEGTSNAVNDGSAYVFPGADVDEPNAAIFSKSDLTITGNGTLLVFGNYNDGITSKDGLVIDGGNITVSAVDDGVRGKDYLVIKNGNITVDAGGDGLKSDNDTDTERGYILVQAGAVQVTSGGDAITAETDVLIAGGQFLLSAGGGSGTAVDGSTSLKGLKAGRDIVIDNGAFTIDSADDAVNANGNLTINQGTFQLASGDDGIHADASVLINDGQIAIVRSYEGIEGSVITINGGFIQVVASDDGINVASGNDGSGQMGPGGGMPGPRGGGGTAPMQDTFNYTGSRYLYIHGGTITVDAGGDGIDINGAIEMTAGLLVISGPTAQNNGAIDHDGGFKMTGGMIVAAGSSGMAMAPSTSSTQNSLLVYLDAVQPGGTLFHIQDSSGQPIVTFAPAKAYQSVVVSTPELQSGASYAVYVGGSASGDSLGGLIQNGTYSPGTQVATVTLSSVVTTLGSGGGRPGR